MCRTTRTAAICCASPSTIQYLTGGVLPAKKKNQSVTFFFTKTSTCAQNHPKCLHRKKTVTHPLRGVSHLKIFYAEHVAEARVRSPRCSQRLEHRVFRSVGQRMAVLVGLLRQILSPEGGTFRTLLPRTDQPPFFCRSKQAKKSGCACGRVMSQRISMSSRDPYAPQANACGPSVHHTLANVATLLSRSYRHGGVRADVPRVVDLRVQNNLRPSVNPGTRLGSVHQMQRRIADLQSTFPHAPAPAPCIKRSITPADVSRLWQHCRTLRDGAILSLLEWTGLRKESLASLRIHEVWDDAVADVRDHGIS